MRMLRATGVLAVGTAACLLLVSSQTASAKERPRARAEVLPAVHPLPRFDALLAALQAPAPKPRPVKTSQVPLPAGEGLDTTKKLCGTCHGTDVFARQRHTKDKWNQIIDNMVSKGMEASDDDLEKMATYLGTNLGPDSPVPPAAGGTPAPAQPAPKPDPQSR